MARLTTGIMGPLSGKVGNLVYYISKGQGYVRSMPKKSTKPPTRKQLIQQAKFRMVMRFLSPLSTLINDSCKLHKKTGMNVAVKQILSEAIVGEYPELRIDFSKVDLVRGRLAPAHGSIVRSERPDQLSIRWPAYGQRESNAFDELLVLIYDSTLSKFWYNLDRTIQRWEGSSTIPVPPAFAGHTLQVWLAFRSEDHRSYSCGQFAGEVLIEKTAGHEVG